MVGVRPGVGGFVAFCQRASGEELIVGRFSSEAEAQDAYDVAAIKLCLEEGRRLEHLELNRPLGDVCSEERWLELREWTWDELRAGLEAAPEGESPQQEVGALEPAAVQAGLMEASTLQLAEVPIKLEGGSPGEAAPSHSPALQAEQSGDSASQGSEGSGASDSEASDDEGEGEERQAPAAAANDSATPSKARRSNGWQTMWWASGEGQCSRLVSLDILAKNRTSMPGFVLDALGLRGHTAALLVQPGGEGRWRAELREPSGSMVHMHGCIKAIADALGLGPGDALLLRKRAQREPPPPLGSGSSGSDGRIPVLEVAAGDREGAPAGIVARAAERRSPVEGRGGQDSKRWAPVAGGGHTRVLRQTQFRKLELSGWMREEYGLGKGPLTVFYLGGQTIVVRCTWDDSRGSFRLQGNGWQRLAESLGLCTGGKMIISKAPAGAPKPAITLAFEQPQEAPGGQPAGPSPREQQAEQGPTVQQQQQQAVGGGGVGPDAREASRAGHEQGGGVSVSGLGKRGQSGWTLQAALAAREEERAKRAKLSAESAAAAWAAGSAAAAAAVAAGSSAVAAAALQAGSSPQQAAAPGGGAGPTIAAAGPAAAALGAPNNASGGAGAGLPSPLGMLRELKQLMERCGVPEQEGRTFRRILGNRQRDDPSTLAFHYEEIASMQDPEDVRDWVLGSLKDFGQS